MSRKLMGILAVLGMLVSMSDSLYAACNQMVGGNCGNGPKSVAMSDPWKKFQADTIDLRQKMMMKHFELQRENLKPVQDQTKIAQLQAEVINIQEKIHDIRTTSGLSPEKCDSGCGNSARNCGNKRMGGCNGTPCNMWK